MRNWYIDDITNTTVSDAQARTSDNSIYFAGTNIDAGYVCQIVYLDADTQYVFSAYAYQNPGSEGANIQLQVYEYEVSGSYLEGTTASSGGKIIPLLTGTQFHSAALSLGTRESWVRGDTAFTSPGTAESISGIKPYIIAINCLDSGEGVYIDDVMLHRGVDTPLPYQPHVTDYFYSTNLLTEIENYNLILELPYGTAQMQTNVTTGELYLDVFNEIDTSEDVYIFNERADDPTDPSTHVGTNYVDNTETSNIKAWRVPGNNKRILLTAAPTSALWTYYTPVSVMAINGSLIVEGSILADKIAASQITGTHISATSEILIGSGNNSVVIDGTHPTYRLWAGNETSPASAAFSVEKDGTLHATGADITGVVTITSGSDIDFAYVTGSTKPDNNADVTSANTAANIAGQGGLATADRADLLYTDGADETEVAINAAILLAGGITLDGYSIRNTAKTYPGDSVAGFFLGIYGAAPQLELVGAAGQIFRYDGTDISMTGAITITSGSDVDFAYVTGSTAPDANADVTSAAIETGITTTQSVYIDATGIRSPSTKTYGSSTPGWYISASGGVEQFDITSSSTRYLRFNGTNIYMTGAVIKTAASGAMIDMQGSYFKVLDSSSLEIFKIDMTTSDITFGRVASGKYMLWDQSAGALVVNGDIIATDNVISGAITDSDYANGSTTITTSWVTMCSVDVNFDGDNNVLLHYYGTFRVTSDGLPGGTGSIRLYDGSSVIDSAVSGSVVTGGDYDDVLLDSFIKITGGSGTVNYALQAQLNSAYVSASLRDFRIISLGLKK